MPPHIAIFVRGGVVQEVASDSADILIKLLDMDSIEEGDPPDQWRPPDVVINDQEHFDTYTTGKQTPSENPSISTKAKSSGIWLEPIRDRRNSP
jgi:hypothetical protein